MSIRVYNPGWSPARQILIIITTAMAIAFPALMLLNPLLASPAHASDNDKEVICPPPISEGETAHLQVRWPGHYSYRVAAFTLQDPESASSEDFKTYDGVWMESATLSSTVHIPAITKEDSTPEPNETFSLGFYENGQWLGCVITIVDDDMPEITNVAITSRPSGGNLYRFRDKIQVTITLNKEVEVEGTPAMSLYVGSGDSAWRGAQYLRGSGSNSLTFRYVVQAHDMDQDGISVSAAATAENRDPAYGFSGKIYAKGTKAQIDYYHGGIANSRHHNVDGRPYVYDTKIISSPQSGLTAYRTNQTIEASFSFNTEVEVEGTVTVDLLIGYDDNNWEASRRLATYLSGSGTNTLLFRYTVRPGDMDSRGIMIGFGQSDRGFGGDGTIKAKGTDVERLPNYYGTGHLQGQEVDTEVPSISSTSFNTQPRNGTAYTVRETVGVAIAFSEKVTISGDPYLDLDVGGEVKRARLQSSDGRRDRLIFHYRVQDGDTDRDGIGIPANSLKLNGGRIYDGAGNAAGLSHDTVTANPNQKVGVSE